VTVPDTVFNSITYYILDNCNFQSAWVINIAGTGTVNFFGGSFPGVAGGLVYNVLGSGRLINVTGTGVTGHILSPNNVLTQSSSVITGKVVVGNIENCVQINKPVCTNPPPVELFSFVGITAPAGTTTVTLIANSFIPGDSLTIGGKQSIVSSINGKTVTLASPLPGTITAGSLVSAVVSATGSRVYIPPSVPVHSGSSSISTFFALIITLIACVL